MGNKTSASKRSKTPLVSYATNNENIRNLEDIRIDDANSAMDGMNRIHRLKSVDNIIKRSFTIHDTMYGYMKFSELERLVIDSIHMQRLRDLKQLAGVRHIYPMAEHSRFVHSLGTSHIAKQIVMNVMREQPELCLTNRHVEIIGIAGLVHDLGHGPYSHSFEHIINKIRSRKNIADQWHHEEMSLILIDDLFDNTALSDKITQEEREFVKYCVCPKAYLDRENYIMTNQHNPLWYFRYVISSMNGIDADRIDYICRDSYHTNIKVSFDYTNIITSTRVIKDILCWSDKCQYDIAKFIDMRFDLYKRIYESKVTKTIDIMIQDAFISIQSGQEKENYPTTVLNMVEAKHIPLFLMLRDSYIDAYRCAIQQSFKETEIILQRIEKRLLYTFVGFAKFKQEKDMLSCLNELRAAFTEDNGHIISHYKLCYRSEKYISHPHSNIYFYKIDDLTQEQLLTVSRLVNQKANHQEYMIWIHNKNKFYYSEQTEGMRLSFYSVCKKHNAIDEI